MIADKKRKILEEMICENSLLIMIGKSEQIRNGDVNYIFRQDSDMLVLTGLHVPDIALIGQKQSGAITWTLFSDEITEKEKIWGTSRISHDEIHEISGISHILPMSEFISTIRTEVDRSE